MLLAATRMHAEKASYFSIKNDFDNKPVRIHIRGENTKPKQTDHILTEKVAIQLDALLKYQHLSRRFCYHNKNNKKTNKKILLNTEDTNTKLKRSYIFLPTLTDSI